MLTTQHLPRSAAALCSQTPNRCPFLEPVTGLRSLTVTQGIGSVSGFRLDISRSCSTRSTRLSIVQSYVWQDVARFLGVNVDTGMFYFDASYRPVPLEMQFVGVSERNIMAAKNIMDEVAYQKVDRNHVLRR